MDFLWRAYYNDGSELWQHNPDTDQRATYADIERDRLSAFGLYQGDQTLVLVDLQDDSNGDSRIGKKRLIWRIRHQMNTAGQSVKIHLIGWQRMVRGANIQSICFVAADGAIVLGGQWRNDLPLRHSIKAQVFETDLLTE